MGWGKCLWCKGRQKRNSEYCGRCEKKILKAINDLYVSKRDVTDLQYSDDHYVHTGWVGVVVRSNRHIIRKGVE